jgi:diguanylate cyclase (GGDEF)-like protein
MNAVPQLHHLVESATEGQRTMLTRLINHVALLSGEWQRPRLEAILIEALLGMTGAQRVAYFKLLETPEETLVWPAVEFAEGRIQVLDDGINPPLNLASLEQRPDIVTRLADAVPLAAACPTGLRYLFPVPGPGSASGFVELDLAAPLDNALVQIASALVSTFRNVMGLLDYSETDTLTGLLNRKTFDEHLIQILANLTDDDDSKAPTTRLPKRRRHHADVSSHWLAVLDIDHFKRINDNFGHLIGDEVLLMVANMIKSSFRFRDKLFRFGGEEFVVILKPTSEAHARLIFERFRMTMENHRFPQVGNVTVSIGYAPIKLNDMSSVIIDNADQALYWSKANGRNQVSSYEALVASGAIEPHPEIKSDIELF